MLVVGIDPGRKTGYAQLIADKFAICHLKSGVTIDNKKNDYNDAIQSVLRQLDAANLADNATVVIESGFVGHNQSAALKLGEMRGALKMFFWHRGCEIVEFTPNEVKQAIVGNGHASKAAVKNGLKTVVKQCPTVLDDNQSDAIAIATAYILACKQESEVNNG